MAALAVPETLQALIAARLDGLEPDDRTLLQDAAVLGQSFTVRALAAVSGADETDIEARLPWPRATRAAASRCRIRARRSAASMASSRRLIREVGYGTLARRDRRTRHLAAARYFEALGDDELAGVLAAHYLAAYQAAPEGEEGDAVAIQAKLALRGAADRARALGSRQQEVDFLALARSVATDPGEEAELLERMAAAEVELGRYEEVHRLLGDAIDRRQRLGDRAKVAQAVAALADALISEYRTAEAESMLDKAINDYGDLAEDPVFTTLLALQARAYFLSNRVELAIEAAERAIAPADRQDRAELVADLMVTQGAALADINRQIEGIAMMRAGLQLARRDRALANRSPGLRQHVEPAHRPGSASKAWLSPAPASTSPGDSGAGR